MHAASILPGPLSAWCSRRRAWCPPRPARPPSPSAWPSRPRPTSPGDPPTSSRPPCSSPAEVCSCADGGGRGGAHVHGCRQTIDLATLQRRDGARCSPAQGTVHKDEPEDSHWGGGGDLRTCGGRLWLVWGSVTLATTGIQFGGVKVCLVLRSCWCCGRHTEILSSDTTTHDACLQLPRIDTRVFRFPC